LAEITAQPLLNFLLALSFTRGKIDFSQDVNLNLIYADLVAAVYERGYEKRRPHTSIRHMSLEQFARVLEEIGLAAWHGDGRTTTVREIEEHCQASGVGKLLDIFQEGARAGITRLLAAFFFRQYGARASGDPTFVFTHKSFGEYLTARRVIRGVEKAVRELRRRADDPDEGWDEKEALKQWVQLCGPTAISDYLSGFIANEIGLRRVADVSLWQKEVNRLFNFMLRHGMPMELTQITPFKQAMFQSRNAEEALLVVLNICARSTQLISNIEVPDPTAFGTWFKRIQGQRQGAQPALAARSLSYLDLNGIIVLCADLHGSQLQQSKLCRAIAELAVFAFADLSETNLEGANLFSADFRYANLKGADLKAANLEGAHLEGAHLETASLQRAYLRGANLQGAHLEGANLETASLQRANLRGANLEGANLEGAHLEGANLEGANLRGANLRGANLEGANLGGAHLEGAHLEGANLEGAHLETANLRGAHLETANLRGAYLKGAKLDSDSLEGTLQERVKQLNLSK
jgi:uncharacterized protein YjbI with pentapeptide repeats